MYVLYVCTDNSNQNLPPPQNKKKRAPLYFPVAGPNPSSTSLFPKKQLIMSSDGKQPAFTAPIERHTFAGVLLDLDGTLVDSKDAITKHWHKSLNLTSFAGIIHELMLIFFLPVG